MPASLTGDGLRPFSATGEKVFAPCELVAERLTAGGTA